MYRLLIVDDEAIIADGLYEVFQDLKHLRLDVYKAYSGNEALDLLSRTRIDIVLTDIRMPGINGLQLLEKIRDSWPKCKVIFLTGYDEFDYVYSAIQYDGVSYILKTEGYGKVIQTVEKAVREIEEAVKDEEVLKKAKEQLATTIELRQKEYLTSLINEELQVYDVNQKQFDELSIPLKAESDVIMLLARIDDMPKGITYSEKSRLLYGIRLIAEQYFSKNILVSHFIDVNSYPIWFFQPHKEKMNVADDIGTLWNKTLNFIKGNIEMVQSACKESLGITLSFVSDDKPVSWGEIAGCFSRLKLLLSYRIGEGLGMILTDKSLIDEDSCLKTMSREERIEIKQSTLEKLQNYLEHGQKDDFRKLFNEATADLRNIKSMHFLQAQELYYSIAVILLSYINKWNLAEKIAFKIGLHKLMNINEHENWSSATGYLSKLADIIFDIQDFEQEERARDIIKKVQKHIDDNIHNPDEYTLIRLADLMYFNPSYLSRLFKQVTGINLSDYICETRIKKAKQLLEDPRIKIYEVAEAVGYGTHTNFARFFKKYTDMTPQEYRDSIIKM